MNYYIWGLGAVGKSFLTKIIEARIIKPESCYLVEKNKDAIEAYVSMGFLLEHTIQEEIRESNYLNLLEKLKDGDYLLDFTTNIKNISVLEYCLKNNIHYLCTADSSWPEDDGWISNHQHFLEYVRIKNEFKECLATSIVGFGMNPGLVSCFVKKCIDKVVETDDSLYIRLHRNRLKALLLEDKYNVVSKMIGIDDIQEVDNDDQRFTIGDPEINTIYSPWSPEAFYYESFSCPELSFGSKRRFFRYQKVYDCDFSDLYLALPTHSYKINVSVYSPQNDCVGHITPHEEVFTISHYLTYKKYKPTVHFVYSPSHLSSASIERCIDDSQPSFCLLGKKQIVGGGESVGVVIQGKRFHTAYFGNYLDNAEIDEVATIRQVSAGVVSAFIYMLSNPNKGMLFPEEVDHNIALEIAKQYLRGYNFSYIGKVTIKLKQ